MPVEIDIDHVALLARLDLSAEERARLKTQLAAILEHAAKVGEVAAADVAPTSTPNPAVNVLRDDVPEPSITHDAAMQNAPARSGGRFEVPKIADTGS